MSECERTCLYQRGAAANHPYAKVKKKEHPYATVKKPQAPPVPNTSGSGGGGGSNTAGGSAGGGEVNYHPLGAAVSAAPPPLAPSSLTGHQPARSQEGAGPGRKTLSNLVVLKHT